MDVIVLDDHACGIIRDYDGPQASVAGNACCEILQKACLDASCIMLPRFLTGRPWSSTLLGSTILQVWEEF